MKPSSWDKQLGLALPLERAAGQSRQTNNPSKNEVGLDVSHHTRVFPRGGEKLFFLTSSFIGRVQWRCFANYPQRGRHMPPRTFEERSPLSLDPDCSATLNRWERELQAVAVLRPV